jgi:hypothetical protein
MHGLQWDYSFPGHHTGSGVDYATEGLLVHIKAYSSIQIYAVGNIQQNKPVL